MDNLNVRIAYFPSMVNGVNIDEMFVDCDSPTLVEVHSRCVFKVNNFNGFIGWVAYYIETRYFI